METAEAERDELLKQLEIERSKVASLADVALYACEISPTHCKCPGCTRAREVRKTPGASPESQRFEAALRGDPA